MDNTQIINVDVISLYVKTCRMSEYKLNIISCLQFENKERKIIIFTGLVSK